MTSAKALAADITELLAQVAGMREQIDKMAKAIAGDAASFTIKRFCERNALSESQYFLLRRQKKGPRTMRTGAVGVRISRKAEADWIREREAEAVKGKRGVTKITAAPRRG